MEMNHTPNWLLRVASVLFVLVMITAQATSGIYAKYVTRAESSDSARVAKFSVTQLLNGSTPAPLSLTVSPSMPGATQTVQVQNDSEVAVRITVTAKTTGNLPLEISQPAPLELAPGAEGSLTVTVSWPAEENSFTYSSEIDHLTITVNCRQVD